MLNNLKSVLVGFFAVICFCLILPNGVLAVDPALVEKYKELIDDKTELILNADSNPSFTSNDMDAIAEVLKINTTLKNLKISYPKLQRVSLTQIAYALTQNATLDSLSIHVDHLVGFDNFIKYMSNFKRLKKLALNANIGSTNFMWDFAYAISVNTTLEHIDISNNQIHDSQAKDFLKFLNNNKVLRTLDLSKNKYVSDDTIEKINRLLEKNTSTGK